MTGQRGLTPPCANMFMTSSFSGYVTRSARSRSGAGSRRRPRPDSRRAYPERNTSTARRTGTHAGALGRNLSSVVLLPETAADAEGLLVAVEDAREEALRRELGRESSGSGRGS